MSKRFSIDGTRHARDVVDDFLACEKTIEGSAIWVPIDSEYRIKWQISVEDIPTDATFDLTSYTLAGFQQFTITINFPPCVWRLEYGPSWLRHNNPITEMSSFDHVIWGPHYHSWEDNRRLAKANSLPDLDYGRVLPDEVRKFEHAMRWFCAQTNVKIRTDQLPDLPSKGLLV